MRRVYRHYSEWEDWQAGLYRIPASHEQADAIYPASLLADAALLREAMRSVTDEWPVASAVNLSHVARNRQAWLGQASCCWAMGVPELITKFGWHLLTPALQSEANAIADEVILRWEDRHLDSKPTAWEKYLERDVA